MSVFEVLFLIILSVLLLVSLFFVSCAGASLIWDSSYWEERRKKKDEKKEEPRELDLYESLAWQIEEHYKGDPKRKPLRLLLTPREIAEIAESMWIGSYAISSFRSMEQGNISEFWFNGAKLTRYVPGEGE